MVVHAYYPADETRVLREAGVLVQNGFEVDVICLQERGKKRYEVVNGIGVYRLPVERHQGGALIKYIFEYLTFFLLSSIVLLFKFIKKRYTVIQVHNPPDFLVFVTIVPKLLGAKIILDIHDPVPELVMSKFGLSYDNVLVKIIKFLERYSTKFADGLIVVSRSSAELLQSRRIQSDKIFTIMNTTDPNLFDRTQFHGRKFKKNDRPLRFIYHGALLKRYGLDTAIKAFYIIKDKFPGLSMKIYGRGEAASELNKLISDLSLEQHIILGGFVPADDIPRLIAETDVGIVPYKKDKFTDLILPTKAFEYIVMDKPVIMSRISAVEDVFDDTAVLFFEPDNPDDLARCILELYNKPQKRRQLVCNAWKQYEPIRWEVMSERYCNLIFSFTGEKKI